MILLLLVSFLGYCLVVNRWLRLEMRFVPFFVVTSLICALYVFAYAGALEYGRFFLPTGFRHASTPEFPVLRHGVRLLFWTGIALFLFWGWACRNKPAAAWRRLTDPVSLLFVLVSLLLYFLSYSLSYYWFDEATHWGRALKIMLRYDALPGTDRYLGAYTHYPPATTLFHYYVSSFLGEREGIAIFANNLILLACVLTGAFGTGRTRYFFTGLLLAVNYIMLHQFTNGLMTITADGAMALLFGACLTVVFRPSGKSVSKTMPNLTVASGLFVLALTKPIGIVLAGVVVTAAVADHLAKSRKWRRYSAGISGCIALGILVAAPLLAYTSWNLRSERLGLSGGKLSVRHVLEDLRKFPGAENPPLWRIPLSLVDSESRARLLSSLPPEERAAFRTFSKAFRTAPLSFCDNYLVFNIYHFSFCPAEMSFVLLLALPLLFVSSPTVGRDRFRYGLMVVLLLAGYASYLLSLFLVYLAVFSEISTDLFPSYPRYAGSCCQGLWMFYLALSGRFYLKERRADLDGKGNARRCFFSWLSFLLLPIAFLIHVGIPYFVYYDIAGRSSETRKASMKVVEKIEGYLNETSTVYLFEKPGGIVNVYLPLDLFPADVHCRSLADGEPLSHWVDRKDLPGAGDFHLLISPDPPGPTEWTNTESYDLLLEDEGFQFWKKRDR